MATVLCSVPLGRKHCGAKMQERSDGFGRLMFVCPACTRRAKRLCRLCPTPTSSKAAWYCAACAKHLRKTRHRQIMASADYKASRAAYHRQYYRQKRRDPVWWADFLARINKNKRKAKEAKHGSEYLAAHGRGHAGRTLPRQHGRWVARDDRGGEVARPSSAD